MNLRVGIVEADPSFRKKLEHYLHKRGVEIVLSVVGFQELAIEATVEDQFDILLVQLSEETAPHFYKYKHLFPDAHLVAHAAESEHEWVEEAIAAAGGHAAADREDAGAGSPPGEPQGSGDGQPARKVGVKAPAQNT